MSVREDAQEILSSALRRAKELPRFAVRSTLPLLPPTDGKLLLLAVGKAAWEMADEAYRLLGDRIDGGIVLTKYGHSRGGIGPLAVREAGHPVPDENTYAATREILALTDGLTERDTVLFCLSGGGSALFERPLLPPDELEDITRQLLSCGADIGEINTLRKRFSAVKGGRFAAHCAPGRVFSILLSDVLGDRPDSIASGPACPDGSTCEEASEIARKYRLSLSPQALDLLARETPKRLPNAETHIAGSVRQLCEEAERVCREKGYQTVLLTGCPAKRGKRADSSPPSREPTRRRAANTPSSRAAKPSCA